MMETLRGSKILCVRLDNMGDVIMTSPAIRALKESFNAHITLLTSSMGKPVCALLPEIDEVIENNVPWVKADREDENQFISIIEQIKKEKFDAVFIFTVFSQNPLPAAMIAYLSEIPVRVAYCRENPYHLLTHWIPDHEPYTFIQHQVQRDLNLVKLLGASVADNRYRLSVPEDCYQRCEALLASSGVEVNKPFVVVHAGVSEEKRQYPKALWRETIDELRKSNYQLIFTGTAKEKAYVSELIEGYEDRVFVLAGELSVGEFCALISDAAVVLSVNTVAIHIAAAMQTPVVVLYAATNPQHTPWKVKGKVMVFDVPEAKRSKNAVLQFVYDTHFKDSIKSFTSNDVSDAVKGYVEAPDEQPDVPVMTQINNVLNFTEP